MLKQVGKKELNQRRIYQRGKNEVGDSGPERKIMNQSHKIEQYPESEEIDQEEYSTVEDPNV